MKLKLININKNRQNCLENKLKNILRYLLKIRKIKITTINARKMIMNITTMNVRKMIKNIIKVYSANSLINISLNQMVSKKYQSVIKNLKKRLINKLKNLNKNNW
jgi:hypothetical protein